MKKRKRRRLIWKQLWKRSLDSVWNLKIVTSRRKVRKTNYILEVEETSEHSDDFPPDQEVKRINAKKAESPVQDLKNNNREEIDKFLESSENSDEKEDSPSEDEKPTSDQKPQQTLQPEPLRQSKISKSSMEDTM